MRCSDHTVTYSVIRRAPGDLRDVLPFFSKQSLANAARELQNMARELQNMGYRVRLKKIPVGSDA